MIQAESTAWLRAHGTLNHHGNRQLDVGKVAAGHVRTPTAHAAAPAKSVAAAPPRALPRNRWPRPPQVHCRRIPSCMQSAPYGTAAQRTSRTPPQACTRVRTASCLCQRPSHASHLGACAQQQEAGAAPRPSMLGQQARGARTGAAPRGLELQHLSLSGPQAACASPCATAWRRRSGWARRPRRCRPSRPANSASRWRWPPLSSLQRPAPRSKEGPAGCRAGVAAPGRRNWVVWVDGASRHATPPLLHSTFMAPMRAAAGRWLPARRAPWSSYGAADQRRPRHR